MERLLFVLEAVVKMIPSCIILYRKYRVEYGVESTDKYISYTYCVQSAGDKSEQDNMTLTLKELTIMEKD